MNCDRTVEAIQRALDADPSGPPPAEVAGHIEGCEACRRVWEELREVESLVSRLHAEEEIEPPRSLHAGIMDAVARRDRPAGARRFRPAAATLRWGLAAAALLAAAVILHGVLTPPGPRTKRAGIAELQHSLSVAALASHWPDFDFKQARNRVIRNTLSPERLAALAGSLPLPGVSPPEPKSAPAAAPRDVTETLEHLWGVGESTLRFLSGDHQAPRENGG